MLCALVTRPRRQAGALASRLRTRGIACMVEPMLEVAPLPWDARAALAGRQAVLLTSANASRELLRAAEGLGGLAAIPPVLAVGEATARPLRRAGLRQVEAAGGDALDLLRLARVRLDPRRGPVAYLSGETVACDLAAALAPDGFAVERSVVYAARPATRLSPALRAVMERGAIQVAPFLSARTAAIFHDLVRREGLAETCGGMIGAALSPRIAEAMRPLPWRAMVIAERPDLDALLHAMDLSLAGITDAAPGCLAVET
ncbi:MAG: uroporphyrinogen-III synthase [Acetobacteraceae bacterium]|nr:uroporphyrinogen-III synthase [Acetobacteraceae bacterium]